MSENKYDGGPAFPVIQSGVNDQGVMDEVWSDDGMSLRDYFAAKAMQSFILTLEKSTAVRDTPDVPLIAYGMADLMLKERNK